MLILQVYQALGQTTTEPLVFPPAQPANAENRMRITANRYLARGDYENALEIYRTLRSQSPNSRYDHNYYKGELKCLLGMQKYVEAELLVKKEIRINEVKRKNIQKRPEYTADLGQVYLALGREDDAGEMFDLAIAASPVNPNIYRIIAGMLMQSRKDEQAVEILIRGEDRMKNGSLSRDIAVYYSQMMDYKSAVVYYLKYLQFQPKRYDQVERAIYAFPGTEEVRNTVIAELEKSVDDPQIVKLLSGYLFSLGRYDDAYKYVVKIDTDGSSLLMFAESVTPENRCDLALQAYSSALQKNPQPPVKVKIMAGMAECHYRTGDIGHSLSLYRQIIEEFKFTPYAESALFNLGMIHQQTYNDPDSAAFYFEQVQKLFPRGKYTGDAGLALANTAVLGGELDDAIAQFQKLIDRAGRKDLALRSQAMLKMGRCLLWNGEPDSAFAVWDKLVRTLPGMDAANDALYDALCLKEADSTAVIRFAEAWLKVERREDEEAFGQFNALAEAYPGEVIGGRAAIEAANVRDKTSGGEEALLFLQSYLDNHSEAGLKDEIYYRMGEICLESLKDGDRARIYFEELLVQTPDSPRAPVVRRKLEMMTGGV